MNRVVFRFIFLIWGTLVLSVFRGTLFCEVINVTTTDDLVNGSLRFAINTANINSEDDTILLPAGTYYLNGSPREDNNSGGDLDINTSHSITIIGDSQETTIIDGNDKYRVFHILQGTLSISNVTIQNGHPRCPSFNCQSNTIDDKVLEHGGGIFNNGTLTLENCIVTNNHSKDGCYLCPGGGSAGSNASHGGGIYNSGTLTILNCTISNNSSGNWGFNGLDPTFPGDGGGIYNTYSLEMTDCLITRNSTGIAAGDGAGIFNTSTGTMTLTRCTISENNTEDGSWCRHCDIGTNGGSGSGIYNQGGVATITYSTISDNVTGEGGFGDFLQGFAGDGAGIANTGEITLDNSTVNGNITGDQTAGSGGGIFSSGEMTITNSTISENSTGNDIDTWLGEHSSGSGGGICIINGTVHMKSCTVSNNQTGQTGGQGNSGHGGGIYIHENGQCFIQNAIVANNQVYTGNEGPDAWGKIQSEGYNLIENITNLTLQGTTTGNQTNVDPILGILSDNGGFTQTQALLDGSPAIDAGNADNLNIDQRGESRPYDMPGIANILDGTDIGAYERLSSYTISGQISANGSGLAGVSLTFDNNGGSTVTDSEGNYSHLVEPNWSGTVTPTKEDYSFTPTDRNYNNVTSNFPNQDYTATPYIITINITNPVNGDAVTGIVNITVEATSNPQNNISPIQSITKIEFYIDNTLLGEDTTAPFQYQWETGETGNGIHSIKVIATNSAGQTSQDEISVTVSNINHLVLSQDKLNFAYEKNGQMATFHQEFLISNSGSGNLNWTITDNVDWIRSSPSSGTNSGLITVTMDNFLSKAPGEYTGTITVESPEADNSPQTIRVNLNIIPSGEAEPAFGSFDTPFANSTVMSSVPFTGWAIDDIGVEDVSIFRKPLNGEGNDFILIGKAIFVEGARTDIEQRYSDYPDHYRAGWGYMMLTNFLPNQGNGNFTFRVIATDKEGNETVLGTRTVFCDNQNAVKPFGAIDTPTQGGVSTGSEFVNFGWALTPTPSSIPTDGSTILVWVDGVPLGNAVYNRYRGDIATLFPNANNSEGAGGYFYLDTTQYQDGTHTIAWSVMDNNSNTDGIGSRYFQIFNESTEWEASPTQKKREGKEKKSKYNLIGLKPQRQQKISILDLSNASIDCLRPTIIQTGYTPQKQPIKIYPNEKGVISIELKEMARLEIQLDGIKKTQHQRSPSEKSLRKWYGFQVIGEQYQLLPIGSTLDEERGIFYWQLGPGFIGNYQLVFLEKTVKGRRLKKYLMIKVKPKY